jgi:hypothetical protein
MVLLGVSCGTGDYPSFVYTNNSKWPVTFKTMEKDSPVYSLAINEVRTMDSDIRGRSEIDEGSIQPRYVGWSRAKNDIYDIQFTDKTAIPVHVSNATGKALTLTEKGGYLEVPGSTESSIEIADDADGAAVIANIYTETPVFEVTGNKFPAAVSFRVEYDAKKDPTGMYVSINPGN